MPDVPYHNHDMRYYRRAEVDERLRQKPGFFHGHPMVVSGAQEIGAGDCMVLESLEIGAGSSLEIESGASLVLVG